MSHLENQKQHMGEKGVVAVEGKGRGTKYIIK